MMDKMCCLPERERKGDKESKRPRAKESERE
jgi:hypothetical protein